MDLAEVNAGGAEAFVSLLGEVYAGSPEVAECAFAAAPFESLTVLHAAMEGVVAASTEEEQIAFINMQSPSSTEFPELRDAYEATFGWKFLFAASHAAVQAHTIAGALETRLKNPRGEELVCSLKHLNSIAWMRLLELVAPRPTGSLTCHVLDTCRGCPAAAMRVELRRLAAPSAFDGELVGADVTDDDGRLEGGPALRGEAFTVGTYEWRFFVGAYFARHGNVPIPGQPFLDVVPVRFGVDNPEQHYHVPLLCSPWSYSTYRGS